MVNNKHVCNRCGQELDFWDRQEDFSIRKERLGFGTRYDGDSMNLRLCCGCMNSLIESCLISPVEERTDD